MTSIAHILLISVMAYLLKLAQPTTDLFPVDVGDLLALF